MEYRTMSMCTSTDYCKGYNEAVSIANNIISNIENQLRTAKEENLRLKEELNFAKSTNKELNEVIDKMRGNM